MQTDLSKYDDLPAVHKQNYFRTIVIDRNRTMFDYLFL